MINVNDLKAQRHEYRQEAERLINAATASKKDLQGSALTQYNALFATVKTITEKLDLHEAQSGQMPIGASWAGPVVFPESPEGYQLNANLGIRSKLGEIYAKASLEQRSQIDALAGYMTGRNIVAAADLRPTVDGGVVIPSFVIPAIERDYAAFAPVVSVARLWATETGADTTFPVLSDSEVAVQVDSAALSGADSTVSGDTPPTALTGPKMHAYKISSKPVFVPRETFTDSPVDIVSEIVGALLARIIRFENQRFTYGTGVLQAQGFITGCTKYVAGAVPLDLDIALDLAYATPAMYRNRGVYMMSDTTAKYLRKLKTGLSGDKSQLWADADATKGTPATLHGYPVVINNDMDSVAADGTFAAKNPLAFGDFSKVVIRQAEFNQPYIYRYQVPSKDGAAVILFRRSDSRLIFPTAITKVTVS